jgi:hypothetical protein
MTLREAWLKCKISEGMFPEESTVECRTSENHIFSFFAHNSLVRKDAVRVNIVADKDNKAFVIYLPVEPFEGLSRTVTVKKSDVLQLKPA